jgi:hypothetical protein
VDLLLSLDYELCGSGAGDVMRDIVYPTSRILDICERHGAKMTIMCEVGEHWAFEQHDAGLRKDLGYSPCGVMKAQIIEAIKRGHDVQLHLHPQWIGAEYGKGGWLLRDSSWRVADLPDGLGSEEQVTSITGALHRGKQTLEDALRPVKADYECTCFRAGGFYAQPSQNIITAMKAAGLRADSSVVKRYKKSTPFEVDYSHVETDKTAWWTTDTDLTTEGYPGEGVFELSVSSKMEPYWRSLTKTKLRSVLRYWHIEHRSKGGRVASRSVSCLPSCAEVLRRMLKKRPSLFDFCTLSSKGMLRRIAEHREGAESPVVILGHSKDFVNDREFNRFLAVLRRDETVRFQGMSEYVQQSVSVVGASESHETGCVSSSSPPDDSRPLSIRSEDLR